jgi:hypothetical protein
MFRTRAWLVALLALAPIPASAQPKKIETKDVSFDSADGVELQGTLYKSAKGGTSPVVMLLHSFGKDPNLGDWKGLATTLAENGFNVLRFDFRGHGKSTVIGNPKAFWADPVNAKYMPGLANKNPLPKKLEIKDVTAKPAYFPMVVNDIMAARVALDKMNDAGDVNTSSVYLIGSTDAATVGLLYMAAEWSRPQVVQPARNWPEIGPNLLPSNTDPAGKDIAGAIWLSAERHQSVDDKLLPKWVALDCTLELRDKNPMLFLYGDKDKLKTGVLTSRFFVNDVLVAKGDKAKRVDALKFTEYSPVKDTANVGVNLLGNKLGTEETILKYLETLEKDRKNVVRTPNRNWTKSPYVLANLYGVFKN